MPPHTLKSLGSKSVGSEIVGPRVGDPRVYGTVFWALRLWTPKCGPEGFALPNPYYSHSC